MSKFERIYLIGAGAFIIFLLCAVLFFRSRPGPTLEGYTRLHALPAIACDDTGRCEEKVILLKGQIVKTSDTVNAEIGRLSKEGYRLVCMDSPGGNNIAAEHIGKEIARLGLDSCVAQKFVAPDFTTISDAAICNSACPWLILSGRKRVAFSQNASVGFHGSTTSDSVFGFTYSARSASDEKLNFESLIRHYGQASGADSSTIGKQISLLERAFDIGAGPTQEVPVIDLQSRYAFITDVRASK